MTGLFRFQCRSQEVSCRAICQFVRFAQHDYFVPTTFLCCWISVFNVFKFTHIQETLQGVKKAVHSFSFVWTQEGPASHTFSLGEPPTEVFRKSWDLKNEKFHIPPKITNKFNWHFRLFEAISFFFIKKSWDLGSPFCLGQILIFSKTLQWTAIKEALKNILAGRQMI